MKKIFKNKKACLPSRMVESRRGFSILETLVVLSVIVLLIAVILPSFQKMRDNQILKSTSLDVSSALDKARSQTLSSVNSSEYGVHFQSDKIVIFQGQVFSSSNPGNESIFIISPASISLINLTGGAVDLYFNRLSGAPDKAGTVTISISSLSKIITISATGAVSIN
ncbi:hypothetical protein A2814_02225 [Candidatus Nomurabacteria bacterium RIFCSPHIGHO2_01_FULL_38_19]|uniref:General secretion pathway GspH domain-containing protein n=1 Tax=Candidatus Nomurabacteria bacterium RIFCSPHIGHO2_01_FULL_38_19 TaxID=1801732 RepID=A0A1F6UUI3_9BACT|nr:MAG: hypothetical protein A2814_02225 [Candidatus Nomurabacteria bacterium RIFCSPHIGHO2_01_FULL_38_19]